MKRIAFLGFQMLLVFSGQAQQNSAFAVVELFTSEGCSSCPAADKILSEISKESKQKNQEVYCLAYHVDYWNKLGWKDPYSKFQFTRRQENYSRVLPSKELYTPQMIVNGTTELVGSKKEKALSTISLALIKKPELELQLKLDSLVADTAFISWKISKSDKNYVLQLAFNQSGISSKIDKGENAGKTLLHDNVVRSFTAVNDPGISGRVKFFLKDNDPGLKSEIIGFIQRKQNYSILSAGRVTLQ